MQPIIWSGAAISAIGLCGILWTIVRISLIRRSGLPDDAMRAALNKVLPLNLLALFIAVIGLMVIVVGIILS